MTYLSKIPLFLFQRKQEGLAKLFARWCPFEKENDKGEVISPYGEHLLKKFDIRCSTISDLDLCFLCIKCRLHFHIPQSQVCEPKFRISK